MVNSKRFLKEREIVAVAKQAGAALLSFWPGSKVKTDHALQIHTKADGSFVTEADYASNKLILDFLKKEFPNDGIYSEETPASSGVSQAERAWIIDPLDGTKSFIDGNDDFSVLVALCLGPDPSFGVMYFPARDQLALGELGGGATLNGKPLRVSTSHVLRDKAVYLRHIKLPEAPCHYDRWMDSGMAFLNVCRGEFDGIILKIVSHQEWDLAAPAVMLKEAGGRISDEFGNPICFEKRPIQYKYFVASNGLVHDQLLKMIPRERE